MSGIANWQAQIRIDIEDLKKRIKVAEGEINNFTNEDRKLKLDIDTQTLESAIQKLDKMLDSLGKGTGDFKQFENLSKELSSVVSEVQSLSKAFGKVDDSGTKTLLSSIQNIDKSLAELNQNILNVNKNMSNMGGNTSGAVKQVENISNAYQDATKEAEKLADTQSKIGQKTNISSDISSQVKVSDSITDQIVANEKKKQEAYKATTETVMYHAGVISKLNKAETNGRFYGSDRGTGYFGTGHYFVDSNTKHELDNDSSYSSLPYTSIDISKYDNLFKATSNEVADTLHTFLKNLTKFTQGSDSFEASELFSQFQKVFGETTMDMQEFDAKLSQLKAYMQSSNMSDRGDSVSTQFMKSLGYGGVDTRGTKYADTRYGTVIYDLKEESVLQANITDELQKQGQMLEKINYEKGQVFDKSEDTRIQGILDQQAKAKEVETEFNKIFDSTNLNSYESELDSVNQKLTENESIINNCKFAIKTADEDAKRFAKEMAEFDLHMSDEEIAETANKNKVEYQERIEELSKEQSLLKDRKQEIESNLNAEYKLANAARERATATVEDRMKDAFPKTSENLKQVVQSEQKVQQEAVETDKALDNISFTPNTEGFEDIIAKFGILREQAEQITKIVKTTKQIADGTPDISYKATLRNGSSYYLGENSTPQVLNANEIVYDTKAVAKNWEQAEKAIQNYMNAITELNNLKTKDKGTGKNSSEIANQVKEVERLKNIAYEAKETLSSIANSNKADTTTWNKWLNVMKQFEQASLGTTQSVAKLEDALRNANNSQINYMNSVVQRFQNNLDKYSADVKREGYKPSNDFINAVSEYQSEINNLRSFVENLSKTKIVDQKQIDSFKQLTQSAEESKKALQNMSASEKGMKFVSMQKEIDKINQILRENPKFCKEAKNELKSLMNQLMSGDPTANLEKIHTRVMEIKNAEELAGRAGKNFLDILASKSYYGFIGQLQSYMSMYVGFYGIMNSIKGISSAVIQLNSDITELSKVSSATSDQIYDDFSSYADIAKDIGGTISDTISATADWSRNGYSIPDSKELARVALLYKNVGDGIDIDSANKSLISTLRGFKMEADEAEKIIDIYNNVSNNEPIDSGGIGEAMQRSAASFNAANTSLQESVALISTTNSVVQNPEKVGNMWKVVSMRIRSATAELEEAGEDTDGVVKSTADLQKMIKSMTGYDILEKDGKTFKSIYNIVLNISKVWNKLSDTNQSALLQALAGKQQSNALSAALSNTKLLEKSYKEAMNSAGSAEEEQQKYQKSIQYSIEQNKAKLEELSNDFLSSDLLKGVIDAGGKFIDILDAIISKLHLIPTLIGGIGAGIAIKNVGEHYIVPVSI